MKPLTDEWVEKAEGDYIVAQKMFRARKQPVNTRYPGTRADKDDARLALTAAKNVRSFLKLALKIDTS